MAKGTRSAFAVAAAVPIATLLAPFAGAAVATAHAHLVQRPGIPPFPTSLGVATLSLLALMVFHGVPVLVATGAAAGGFVLLRRFVTTSLVPLGVVAAAGFVYVPIALGRHPNGDGGDMSAFQDSGEAMVASGIACWCVLYAWLNLAGRTRGAPGAGAAPDSTP